MSSILFVVTQKKLISSAPYYLDEGGWNNIRMSMETAVTMALAMGRTLVMPPEQGKKRRAC